MVTIEALLGSTVKGVPRSLKSKHTLLRVLWSLSVIILVSVALYTGYLIIVDYLKYEYSTLSTDMSVIGSGVNYAGPAITLCNLNGFSGNASSQFDELGLMSLGDYEKMIENITHCEECSKSDKGKLIRLRNDLLTPHGYYTYIGKEYAEKLSHTYEEFVVGCYLHKIDGYRSHLKGCSQIVVTQFMDPDYYACYTLKIDREYEDYFSGVSLILHLDNYFDHQFDHLDVTFQRGQHIGAMINLHEVGKFPTLYQDSVFVGPGFFTDIKMTVSANERLGYPYTNCTNEWYVPGTSYIYTSDHCASVCIEKHVASHCLCKDIFMLNILEDTETENLTYCIDPGQGRERLLEKVHCVADVRITKKASCYAQCPMACDDVKYDTLTSSARWPPDPLRQEFYESHIANRSYEWRYERMKKLMMGKVGRQEALIMSEYKTLVRNNFLRVDIDLKEDSYILNADQPKTSLPAFIADLGGAMNIFAGITFWVFVEIAEYFFTICFSRSSIRMMSIGPVQEVTRLWLLIPLIARFIGPTWGLSGADRTQVGPMLAPWALLSGTTWYNHRITMKICI